MSPGTHLAEAAARMFSAPSWLAHLPGAAPVAASCELLYRMAKRYDKPSFDIDTVEAHGARVAVVERTVLSKPFCRLQRFDRYGDRTEVVAAMKEDPVLLVVAPLSGHHATLLRDTVRSLLSTHQVYVTDWIDARAVPLAQGRFALDDYVGYLRAFFQHIGPERLHVLAVCQAAVPSLAAVSLTAAAGETQPCSLTLMGGPIDTRRSPTQVNHLATGKPLSWFENNLLHVVPDQYLGRGRRVFPGFLQHANFIAMNPVRHMGSHLDFYQNLVRGDHEEAAEHRRFYDEYNAVLDMPAEYFLDCVRIVFQETLLPRGLWNVGGERVAPEAVTAALMTIEGELDDISGLGQTQAAHELCSAIPFPRRRHLTVSGAGHYGIFNGRRWREVVYPQLCGFMAAAEAPSRRSAAG
jgi:poly(3-hydroxybutyrate) depolymerase